MTGSFRKEGPRDHLVWFWPLRFFSIVMLPVGDVQIGVCESYQKIIKSSNRPPAGRCDFVALQSAIRFPASPPFQHPRHLNHAQLLQVRQASLLPASAGAARNQRSVVEQVKVGCGKRRRSAGGFFPPHISNYFVSIVFFLEFHRPRLCLAGPKLITSSCSLTGWRWCCVRPKRTREFHECL